eukprot:3716235-Pyramimonas_sp.AAC.1
MELYIGNNHVCEMREVQQLRDLPKLIILDLLGNPLCQSQDYRLYVIYHLRKLKVRSPPIFDVSRVVRWIARQPSLDASSRDALSRVRGVSSAARVETLLLAASKSLRFLSPAGPSHLERDINITPRSGTPPRV